MTTPLVEAFKATAHQLREVARHRLAGGDYQAAQQLRAEAATLEAKAEAAEALAEELARRIARAINEGIPRPLVAEACAIIATIVEPGDL